MRTNCRHKLTLVVSALLLLLSARQSLAQNPPEVFNINFGETLQNYMHCATPHRLLFNANAGDRVVSHITDCQDYGGGEGCSNCFCFDQELVLSSNGAVLSSNFSPSGNNNAGTTYRTELAEETVPSTGQLALDVNDRQYNGRGLYAAFVQNVTNPERFETIAHNDSFLKTLTSCGEVDTFTIQAEAGQFLQVEMSAEPNSEVVPWLVLHNPDGRLAQRPGNGVIGVELRESGRYTLLAYSQHSTAGTYRLTVQVLGSTPVDRSSGIQLTPDGAKTLINKNVGNQHWAITLDHGNGTVTGNVSIGAGESTTFVFCTETGREGDLVDYLCSGADPCVSSPCTQSSWVTVGEVSLPLSFFEVPE